MIEIKFRCVCGYVRALTKAELVPGALIRCPMKSCGYEMTFPTIEEWDEYEKELLS